MASLPLLLLMFLGGAAAGGGWALIAAVPRALVGLNEIITTLFLNYIGILLLNALVNGPWKDPTVIGFAYSRALPAQAALPVIGTTGVTVGIFIALGAALVVWWLVDRTRFGFSLNIAGGNVRAAQYLGLGVRRRVILVLGLSGALAGIAGVVQLTATSGRLQDGLTGNYGYTGILVAFLARQRVFRHGDRCRPVRRVARRWRRAPVHWDSQLDREHRPGDHHHLRAGGRRPRGVQAASAEAGTGSSGPLQPAAGESA